MEQSQPKRFFLFLCLLISLLAPAEPALAKNTLWQVTKEGNTLYLLGSMHVLQKDSYPLAPFIEEVYRQSNPVVFETNLDEMETPEMQNKMLAYSRLPTGQTLQQQLSPQTWLHLQEKVASMNLSLSSFQQMRPWFCALTLTVIALEKQGFLPQYGLDLHLYEKAKKDKKMIMPLESVDFQLSLFFNQSRREQENFLKQTLTDLAVIENLADDMEHAWKTGDAPALHSLLMKSFEDYPAQYERLVLQRNKNWIPVLEKILQRHELSLVVVGAGHLVGPNSVVNLLQRRGYQIRQR